MRALVVKLRRDLFQHRGQSIAIGLVMASGVATLIMSLSMLDSMATTMSRYYADSRFAKVFLHVERAPRNLIGRIAETPGVALAQGRIVERVTLDMPAMEEPASGKIISLPRREGEGLNLVYLRAGRYPQASGEVLVGQRFATAHGLIPGSEIDAVLNGKRQSLRVVGIALSAEFVYLISPGSILPENSRYGVFWMGLQEMEAAFDMEGAFNDVVLSLTPGAVEEAVIARVDELTARYGSLGAYGRIDQASHRFLDNELKELRGSAIVVPVVFMLVASFLLNSVLARMISTQREQIAALRALGYSAREVGLHYLQFVLVIAVSAALLGVGAGIWMGRGMTDLYAAFFDFPSLSYTVNGSVVAVGVFVSIASASLGVINALRDAMRLPPAEAMRPKAPPSFHPGALERLGVHTLLPSRLRMVARQLERQRVRSALSMLGVVLATAILVLGSYTEDAVDYILDHQFNRVLRHDANVVLFDQTDESALSTVRSMPGVLDVEPYRRLAARLRVSHRHEFVDVLALDRADGMQQLVGLSGATSDLSEGGLLVSSILAERLHVRPGDMVTFEALEGRRPVLRVPVTGVIDDFSGLSAYVSLDSLNHWLDEPRAISGIMLQVDDLHAESLYAELKRAPRVVAVNSLAATREAFRDLVAQNVSIMRPFLVGFSVIIAFGVIYNSVRVSLSERARDLATMRVLGFTRNEIASIQLGELVIVAGVAIPIGLLAGYALAKVAADAAGTEILRMPFVIDRSTFGFASTVVAAASVASGIIAYRRIGTIDPIAVLKSRE